MTLEEFRKNRNKRLLNLQEALTNMPEIDSNKVHGEIDATEFTAIKDSNERDEKVKEAMKDKNKETREFIQDQDKATEADKDAKSEDRLILDESLFVEDYDDKDNSYFGTYHLTSEMLDAALDLVDGDENLLDSILDVLLGLTPFLDAFDRWGEDEEEQDNY